ncbi:Putative Cellulose-binding domain, fungal, GDSL lipase/esterase, SGNH hydrolase superfamily [Colletotrichum destructivum]|uniref:Cellulose-binding domain, fungal, GDSL lipase/esterase, SGNH hydrolase superfamily n=1 Tax=Colletotrichum destructivum TaxID=34406 RepID=A0AAX4ICA4_9PEZI|nr:Putative Cellulose-binding domain, fungal, GDSL lipase/esterase, SGNH hydrolase superfamily [Colletotrichum destructivum]
MARITASVLFTASLALTANAQAPVWGQCGGNGWGGSTSCAAGSYCSSQNPWYYQCVPGTTPAASSTRVTSVPASTTSRAVTTTALTTTAASVRSSSSSRAPSSTSVPVPVPSGPKYFITFGDSYSQTGFNINSTKPNPQNPLGNPALPGWTASGGLDWVGFMVTQFNASLTYSYNLAYGGATTDASLIAPYTSTVLSFIDQVAEFSRSLAPRPAWAPWTADNTLVGVWMGVNDVGNAFWSSNREALLVQVLAKYFEQLQILYDAGVRKFVLLSVPPTQKTPLMLANGADSNAQLAAAIKQYNDLIVSNLAAFKTKNAGVTSWIVDTAAAFDKAIANPTAYGSPDATCFNADGVSCLWFNDYHPGVQIQRLVGQAVAQAVGQAVAQAVGAPWFTA